MMKLYGTRGAVQADDVFCARVCVYGGKKERKKKKKKT